MTAIALVLLVLGFLFATLQYPAPMKRFWKWTLIGVASMVLAAVVAVLVINARDANNAAAKLDEPDAFAHLIPKQKTETRRVPSEMPPLPKGYSLLPPQRVDLLLEAERRGILPPDMQAALSEARRRGLVPPALSRNGGAEPFAAMVRATPDDSTWVVETGRP